LGVAVYSEIINYSPFVWAISMIMYVNNLEPYHMKSVKTMEKIPNEWLS